MKRLKKSRLHIGKELYKKSKYNILKLITKKKKRAIFDDKLSEYTEKSKKLWETFNPVESNNIIFQYYSKFNFENPFHLSDTSKNKVFKIMQNMGISKAVGTDNLSGRFLKDGAEILAKPLSEI